MTPIRVLHVDDEIEYAASLGRRLERRGMLVTHAASGPEAIRTMEEDDFDVILMDVRMPGMDGIKTLGSIKSGHPTVEVIMLTAHANTDIVMSSVGMGAYDYMTKPTEVEQIVSKITDAAHRRKANLARLAEAKAATT